MPSKSGQKVSGNISQKCHGAKMSRTARADAMVVFPLDATMVARAKIAQFAIAQRLPSMFGWSS